MSNKSKLTHFKVGNGNCSIIEADDFLMVIDLNKTEDKDSSYNLLKPFFRQKGGKDTIDVLYITHGDEDHCLGFKKFKEEIDAGNLVIGTIWHQGYDREKNHDPEKDSELPEDYLVLNKEIKRRLDISNPEFGDIVKALKSKDASDEAFDGIDKPDSLEVKVLSPFDGDDEDSNYNHNDLSLIINVTLEGKSTLYTGDASSKYWQEKIIPDLLNDDDYSDWAKADILEVGHHGSYDFFGENREDVRDSNDEPDNYEALNKTEPDELIISAESKFPLSGDSSGDQPPHYAAWKWYHKWFRDNHNVSEDDKHPNQFKYTSEGNIRLEYTGTKWKYIDNWDHNEKANQAKRIAESMKAGTLSIGGFEKKVSPTKYFGENVI
ncbi:MAG: MBL fold metallo-hydrolase [Salinivirgaceae bacterium]|nr:MBL fold metallo-hydrolase [Salinivirgaceae bacterium]